MVNKQAIVFYLVLIKTWGEAKNLINHELRVFSTASKISRQIYPILLLSWDSGKFSLKK